MIKVALFASFLVGNILLPQQANAVCRNLVPTDPYYSRWTYCCDLPTTIVHSYWIKRGGNGKKMHYTGSCNYWGITEVPLRPVCRNLQPSDPYYNSWRRCCDEGRDKSRWYKRYGYP